MIVPYGPAVCFENAAFPQFSVIRLVVDSTVPGFFFQALNFLVESFGLLNNLFPLPSILDAGYPVFLSSFGRCPV
jgi:hypothetical protein